MNPNFCQKNCALNRDAYFNGCVLKREIIVFLDPEIFLNIERWKEGVPKISPNFQNKLQSTNELMIY